MIEPASLLAVIAVCAACGLLSCWLVQLGWSLLGDAVSHAVLPGVVVAALVGFPLTLGGLALAFGAVGLIGVVRSTGRLREDAGIGVVFTALFALGLALISATGVSADLDGIIFGEADRMTTGQAAQTVALAAAVIAVLLVGRRAFTVFAFDSAQLVALGWRPRLVSGALLATLAVVAVAAMQVVGVVLVVAMLITPGATASLLTRRFAVMLWVAPALAAASGVVGVLLGAITGAGPGPMVVLVQGAAFGVVLLTTQLLRRRLARQPR